VVQARDSIEETSFEVGLAELLIGEKCLEVRLERHGTRREEIVSEECLAARNLGPMIISFLHLKELLGRVDAPEGLTARELELLLDGFVLNFVGVARESNRLLRRVLRLQRLVQELGHSDLELHVSHELLSVLTLFDMLDLAKVIEGGADEL